MNTINRADDIGLWKKFFLYIILIVVIGGVLWADAVINAEAEARDRQEYVVVYYPKNGPSKTFDSVNNLHYGSNFAEFVYMGKKVRLNGDMEITRK